MGNETVSIIIPVYNVAPYVERCIRSLMNQTYKELEIIIVDDGSTDGSFEICAKLSKEDNRIKHIKGEHQGVSKARNIAIENATGKYMIFVDADDYAELSYVKNVIEEMEDQEVVFAGFAVELEQKSGELEVDKNNTWIAKNEGLADGIYQGEDLRKVWSNIFRGDVCFFAASIWKFCFLSSKMKAVYKQLDERIWMGEDVVLSRAYLFQCDKIKLISPMGYHKWERMNTGINERYFYSKAGALENIDRLYWNMRQIIKNHKDENLLKDYLDREIRLRILEALGRYNVESKAFYYPYHGRLIGKKVVLYGAGNVGKSFRESILSAGESHLVLWVDKVPRKEYGVSEISEILDVTYDYIIVAIFDEKVYEQIKVSLMEMGVPEEKILWNRTRQEVF